jgi:hypothetical protein
VSEISIFDAWTLWFAGHLSPNLTLWGVTITWWGRIGKIMQVIGATTIVADIIGPEKIRRFGSSLNGAITSTVLTRFLKDCFEWYAVIFRYTLMKDYVDEPVVDKKEPNQSKLDIFNYVVCFLLTSLVVLSIQMPEFGWVFLIEVVIIFFCLLVSISPIITVLVIIMFALGGLTINFVFIKSLAWILEHPSLDQITKLTSLFLLLVGFHFELLAS